MTRDAIIGPWAMGKYPITTPDFVGDDLAYLSGTRRFQTRLGALSGHFQVTSGGVGSAKGATLALDGTTILTLKRPTDAQLHAQLPPLLDATATCAWTGLAKFRCSWTTSCPSSAR